MTSRPQPSPAAVVDVRIDFSNGATWRCTSCGTLQTIGEDEDGEDTGLPALYVPSSGIAVCDACTEDGSEDPEPQ